MKTKKLRKKLTLNKKTVVDLNHDAMMGINGGIDFSVFKSCWEASCRAATCIPTDCATVCASGLICC